MSRPASTPCEILPRRFISSSVAAHIKSNSPSLKCLTAFRRFLARTCRCDAVSVAASVQGNFGGAGVSSTAAAENRSGVRSVGLRPMALACRVQGRSAISSERPVHTPALTVLAALTRAREAAPIPARSDADRPAPAGWAALRLLADVDISF